MENKLILIRRKCIEANPKIMGTCSGCGKVNPTIKDECEEKNLPHINMKPRPIQLADVLMAIQKRYDDRFIQIENSSCVNS